AARVSNEGRYDVNLNHEILSATSLLHGIEVKKGVRIDLHFDHLPKVYCCPAKICQVVLILVTQAVEACCERGVVTVRTRAEPEGVRIEVAYSGNEIEAALHHRIFDSFPTTEAAERGAGLGLTLCHRIILDHGGTISFNGAPGQGSCFTVRLPLR